MTFFFTCWHVPTCFSKLRTVRLLKFSACCNSATCFFNSPISLLSEITSQHFCNIISSNCCKNQSIHLLKSYSISFMWFFDMNEYVFKIIKKNTLNFHFTFFIFFFNHINIFTMILCKYFNHINCKNTTLIYQVTKKIIYYNLIFFIKKIFFFK